MTARSTYYIESLIPAWLQHDTGYRNALGDHLLDRMALQDYTPVASVRIVAARGDVDPPVGTVLLRAEVDVEEFDIEVGSDG